MDSWILLTAHLPKDTLYLDPGSGSFLLQLLAGALMGGLLAIKIYWRKIKTLFKKEDPSAKSDENDEEE